MTTTNNITTSTVNMNIYNNTDQPINPDTELLNNNPSNVYIPTKICNACRTIKYVTEFYKDKSKRDGYHSQCKNCHNNRQKEYYVTNKDKIATKGYEYRENNKEKLKEDKIKYYQNNKDKIKENKEKNKDKLIEQRKEYNQINKDKHNKYCKEWRQLNKYKVIQYKKEYEKNRIINNPVYRFIQNNRTRIWTALKSNSKATNTIELLQCDGQFFYKWIKFCLPYDMSDDEFRNNYEIDHVVPLSSFNLSIPDNQFIAFNWQNCSPLLKSKNRIKGAKRDLWSELMQDLKVTVFFKIILSR